MTGETDSQRRVRIGLEAAGWVALVTVLWGSDLLAEILALQQRGVQPDLFRLVSEQVTSAIAVLIMVPLLVQWLKLLPTALNRWVYVLVGHTIGSIVFAFGHYALMIAMRIPWYALNGRDHVWREALVDNLTAEYQNDIKIYIGFVVVILVYRQIRLGRSGS